jgi:hypothetical protein
MSEIDRPGAKIEVLQLADELALRFGAPKTAVLQ